MSGATISSASPIVTAEHRRQYQEQGYFVLPGVVPPPLLQILRDECQGFINQVDAELAAKGVESDGPNHRGRRYFIDLRYKQGKRLHEYIFSDILAEICRATIGPDAFLFYEQWVIKCAEVGMKFAWHQDSGYVGFDHKPYVTTWCPLDDVNEENGTVYLLPYSRAGTRALVPHTRDPGSTDLIGYRGPDPGDPVIVPAGSIAVFSSLVFHRSGPNTTKKPRRVYLAQYASAPIVKADGTISGLADPFLKNGKVVAACRAR